MLACPARAGLCCCLLVPAWGVVLGPAGALGLGCSLLGSLRLLLVRVLACCMRPLVLGRLVSCSIDARVRFILV